MPGDDPARAAANRVAQAYCHRLFSDCASQCAALGSAFCPSSEPTCVADEARRSTDRYAYPMASDGLAAGCAAQLGSASCSDLSPDSVECDSWLVNGCPNDDDGFGTPYSALNAAPLPVGPAAFSPLFCEHVVEYFSVDLDAGEGISLDWAPSDAGIAGQPVLRIALHRVKLDDLGRTTLVEVDRKNSGSWPYTYRAALAGKHVLTFDAYSDGRSRPDIWVKRAAE